MGRYRLESAEEGTPAVDAYLAAGFEPFAVVSTPVMEEVIERIAGLECRSGRYHCTGHVNVIWFRRRDA